MSGTRFGRMHFIFKLASVSVAGVCLTVLVIPATTGSATTLPTSGQALFLEHCAQCHGQDGTGNGPMAKDLKATPADLTAISKRANGHFPADRVVEIIRYGGNVTGHGPQDMPIWGKVFNKEGGGGTGGDTYSRRAVVELLKYLQTIQKN
jgi:mono/diheme cytochrome c family protein